MRNLARKLFLVAVVMAAALSGGHAASAENDWLVGSWELVRDPDGHAKDWMEFTSDGRTTSISAQGRRVPGVYTVTAGTVDLLYVYNGKQIPLRLTYNDEKTTLFARSPATGSISEYKKSRP